MKNLNARKAAGMDGLATEYLKMGGNACSEWQFRLFNLPLNSRRLPMDSRMEDKVPVYKGKDNPHDCEEISGISLLSVMEF